MHRCLLVSEIISECFEQVDTAGRQGRMTLSAAAQTCRAWSGPALDALWYHLPNLAPLVQCFRRELWERRSVRIHRHLAKEIHLRALEPMQARDWARAKSYFTRVRHVGYVRFDHGFFDKAIARGPFIDNSVFEAWKAQCGSSPMLPRIVTFHGIPTTNNAQFVEIFLSPSLVDLTLPPYHTFEPSVEDTIDAISERCPHLKNLNLLSVDPGLAPFYVAPAGFFRLQSLNADSWLTWLAIGHLGLSTNLHTLTLVLSDLPGIRSKTGSITFPVLEMLRVCTETLRALSAMLSHITSNKLSVLHVHTKEELYKADDLRPFLGKLAAFPFRAALQDLRISCEAYDLADLPLIEFNALTPLFAMHSLRRLAIPACNWSLDSTALDAAGTAWPDLCVIALPAQTVVPNIVTLPDVLPLLLKCRSLEVIDIPFDVSSLATDSVSEPLGCQNPNRLVRRLQIWPPTSNVEAAAVAAFLAANLPDVAELYYNEEYYEESEKERACVAEILRLLEHNRQPA